MRTLRLTEFGAPEAIAEALALETGLDLTSAHSLVAAAGERLRLQHRLKDPPLRSVGGLYRAEDVAGVVSLHDTVDLAITPKYATAEDRWAEDLLFLSLFATYGRLDPINLIAADLGSGNDLAELLGRVLLQMISANDHHPLHRRQRVDYASFDLDGDFDPADLLSYTEEGWLQTGYRFTTDNVYASTISEACRLLIGHVREATTRNMLRDRTHRFGRQTKKPLVEARRLPPRFSRWQDAFDLAQAILAGAGLTSAHGTLKTLGFSILTWRTWESLIERSLVIALGAAECRLQPRSELGSVTRGASTREVYVYPDAIVRLGGKELIVDAKYKGRAGDDGSTISVSDRYEALAFIHATAIKRAVLVYPATTNIGECGAWSMTETFTLPVGEVRAYSIQIAGISQSNGFSQFLAGLRTLLQAEVYREAVVQDVLLINPHPTLS